MKIRRKRASAQEASVRIKEQLLEETRDERDLKLVQKAIGRYMIPRLSSRKALLRIREVFAEEAAWLSIQNEIRRQLLKIPNRRVAKTTTSTGGRQRTRLIKSRLGRSPWDVPEALVCAAAKRTLRRSSVCLKRKMKKALAVSKAPGKQTDDQEIMGMVSKYSGKKRAFQKERMIGSAFDKTTLSVGTYCICAQCHLSIFDYHSVTGRENETCRCNPDITHGLFCFRNAHSKQGGGHKEAIASAWLQSNNSSSHAVAVCSDTKKQITVRFPGGENFIFDKGV